MFVETCRFCEHVNPPDAKFCNACGGALHLMPCSRCGAVNDATATTCYQCHSQLPGRVNGAPEVPLQPTAEPPSALPRPHSRAFVGTAIFAVVVVAGYFSYRQASHPGAVEPTGASSRVDGRGSPDSAGVSPRNAIAGVTAPSKRDDSIGSVSTAAAQPKIPLGGAAPVSANQLREGGQSVESGVARVAAAQAARTKATNEGRGSERVPPRLVACTKAVTALGLCTLKPVQETGTKTPITANR
jgi:ribosomal protein L40E